MSRKWDYYRVGDTIRDANIRIIKRVYLARTMSDTKYEIQHLCCGDCIETTHRYIRRKEANHNYQCKKCARANSIRALNHNRSKGVIRTDPYPNREPAPPGPTWPVPPSVKDK